MKKNTDSNITCSPPSRRTLRNCTFIVDGVPMSLTKAAAALGYASISGLAPKIRQRGIPENSDISHLKNTRPARAKNSHYLVDGQRVSLSQATKLLGFKSHTQLAKQIKELSLPPESDISHIKPA